MIEALEGQLDASARCNPFLALYAVQVAKGLAVVRSSDGETIASIYIRDLRQVANYDWDPTDGKFLFVCFTDGTIRIYDIFRSGKLTAFLKPARGAKVDYGVWLALSFEPKSGDLTIPEEAADVSQMFPKLVKFVKDQSQIVMANYTPPYTNWQTLKDSAGDLHVVHHVEQPKLSIMVNGTFSLNVMIPTHCDGASHMLRRMIAYHHRVYLFYKDECVDVVNFRDLQQSNLDKGLLDTTINIMQLLDYLSDHISLIKRDIVLPYTETIQKICNEHGQKNIYNDFNALLFFGDLSIELEEWLCNSVGQKNIKKWKKLGLDMYEKAVQVITGSLIPAIERLFVLRDKLESLIKAFGIQNSWLEADRSLKSSSLEELMKNLVVTVQMLNEESKIFHIFLQWFEDRLMECLDEDYGPKLGLDASVCRDLSHYFNAQLGPNARKHMEHVSQFDKWLCSFREEVCSIIDEHVRPILQSEIVVSETSKLLFADKRLHLLDVAMDSNSGYLVYLARPAAFTNDEQILYHGLIDSESMEIVSKNSYVVSPKRDLQMGMQSFDTAQLVPTSPPNVIDVLAAGQSATSQNPSIYKGRFLVRLEKVIAELVVELTLPLSPSAAKSAPCYTTSLLPVGHV